MILVKVIIGCWTRHRLRMYSSEGRQGNFGVETPPHPGTVWQQHSDDQLSQQTTTWLLPPPRVPAVCVHQDHIWVIILLSTIRCLIPPLSTILNIPITISYPAPQHSPLASHRDIHFQHQDRLCRPGMDITLSHPHLDPVNLIRPRHLQRQPQPHHSYWAGPVQL